MAGILSPYYGKCPRSARHATFVCRIDRFRRSGGGFVWCWNGSSSSRTYDRPCDRSGVISSQKTGPGISTCGRACAECVAALWQLRINDSSSPGKGEYFLSQCADRLPSVACRGRRRELTQHVAKNWRTRLDLACQKARYLDFAWLVPQYQPQLARGLQRKLFIDGSDPNDIRNDARFRSKARHRFPNAQVSEHARGQSIPSIRVRTTGFSSVA